MFKINNAATRIIAIYLGALTICLFLFVNIAKIYKTNPVEILVASQDIPSGVYVKPEMVFKTNTPFRSTNSDEIKDLEEVAGLITITSIPKGKPIVYTQFSPTEKAQAPIQSHNPTNYYLAVDENTNVGKLFLPGTIDSYLGKFTGIKSGPPFAVFPFVHLVYLNTQPIRPFGYAENKTLLFTLTPTQVEDLKSLSGQTIQLTLKGITGDEVADISPFIKR